MTRAEFERILCRRADRRRLLAAGASSFAAWSFAGRPTRLAGAQTPAATSTSGFGGTPFTLGVASGDPLPDGVVLWTRLAPTPLVGDGGMAGIGSVEVRWEVAADDAFRTVVQSGATTADPSLGHSVHVDITGLEPGRDYFYRFLAGSELSPVGRSRTAPAADAPLDRLRFAFSSCQDWLTGHYTAYRHMAQDDLDLVFFLGDYIYEDAYGPNDDGAFPTPGREHTAPEILTLDDYRVRHALHKSDPELQAAHAAAPWIVTWDDHEVENDYANEWSENGDPADLFLDRRAAAYQAYYEHQPLRPDAMPLGPAMQLYRRLAWGDLADISVLDTRQYRSDHPCGDGVQVRCPAALDPDTTMLGPEQERWLLTGLDASPATWNVIAQSLQMAELEQAVGSPELFWGDSWPGYPAARNRILSHVQSRGIANPIVLSGDIHTSWANDLKADWTDPASPTLGSEFTCTSISSEGDSPSEFFRDFLPENPHIRFFDARHGGYVLCEVTPETWRGDFRVLDFLTRPDAPIATVSSWVVEAGRPGLQEG
jgi:alkaline phosphatase D